MKKLLIIDSRMRDVEKNKLIDLGYQLIKIERNNNIYEEISSHVDIFACKVGKNIIVEPSQYGKFIQNDIFIKGQNEVKSKYPDDIKYNVCIIGKKAIHYLNYTDEILKQELIKNKYELIDTVQGYTNCSIAVIDDNSAIVTDKGLFKILKAHGIDVLFIQEDLDIKLFTGNKYSDKKGFIGGCISRIGNKVIVFGDLSRIDEKQEIRKFINKKGLEIIEFKGIDVIDYGGIIEV